MRLLDVPGDGSSPSLTVTCEDVDEVSGADFMGQFTVDLGPLTDHKPVRRWYQLQEAEGRKGEVAGHVELFLQWVYNPVTAFDPFAPSETEGEPNELRIGLGLCGNKISWRPTPSTRWLCSMVCTQVSAGPATSQQWTKH